MTFKLADLTYEDASRIVRGGAVALIPCGATEAHGPHLPLSTDVIISETAATRAAALLAKSGTAALVLPPLAYAVTDFALGFAGTISLPRDTALAFVRDVCLATIQSGFRAVVLCNAHLEPGHLETLRGAVEQVVAQGGRATFPDVTRKPHALRLGEEFKSGACHAGSYETSLVLAARPELVRMEIARDLTPNPISLSRAIRDGKKNFLEAGGDHAYFGDPSVATALEGDSLYDELAAIFADAAREVCK